MKLNEGTRKYIFKNSRTAGTARELRQHLPPLRLLANAARSTGREPNNTTYDHNNASYERVTVGERKRVTDVADNSAD